MAEKPFTATTVTDYLGPFDGGLNSGLPPILLAKNVLSFARNATLRGYQVTNRPPYRKMVLDFGGDTGLRSAVINGRLQGACFYKSDSGVSSLAVSISGRIFLFTPGDRTCVVKEIGIPGDPNLVDGQEAWLWQGEQFLIVNDGLSLPMFYDGTSSRRSRGRAIATIGTSATAFTVPAVGSAATLTLTDIYTGPLGGLVLFGDGEYTVNTQATTNTPFAYTVTMQKVNGTKTGTNFVSLPLYIKSVTAVQSGSFTTPTNGHLSTLAFRVPFTGGIAGSYVQQGPVAGITQLSLRWKVVSIAADGLSMVITNDGHGSSGGVAVADGTIWSQVLPGTYFAFPGFSGVVISGNPYVITPAGTMITNFVSPIVGGVVAFDVGISAKPTVGAYVWLGTYDEVYLVQAVVPRVQVSYSISIKNVSATAGATVALGSLLTYSPNELPPGRMGVYGLGRIWMSLSNGREFIGGDIVKESSGTAQYEYRDAILSVRENSFLFGGGTFSVPGAGLEIKAMQFVSILDASMGQGPLQILTGNRVFSCAAPVDRTTWQSLTNPILTESLKGIGGVAQDATLNVNGDLLFRSRKGLASLILGRREFLTWGNTPISFEVRRVIEQDGTTLLPFSSVIEFDNRFIFTCTPETHDRGIIHKGLIALNFDPVSGLRGKAPSIYDGLWNGLSVLKLIAGDFNDTDRAFALAVNTENQIELQELLPSTVATYDDDGAPIVLDIESASLFKDVKGKDPKELLRLLDGELQFDDMRGPRIDFRLFWRPDQHPCWQLWHQWSECLDTASPGAAVQFRPRVGVGEPSSKPCDPSTNRPLREGHTFQFRLVMSGHARLVSARFRAVMVPQDTFARPICACPPGITKQTPLYKFDQGGVAFWNPAYLKYLFLGLHGDNQFFITEDRQSHAKLSEGYLQMENVDTHVWYAVRAVNDPPQLAVIPMSTLTASSGTARADGTALYLYDDATYFWHLLTINNAPSQVGLSFVGVP